MQNKVVVITGASSGIGKACAEIFADNDFSLVLCGRSETKLKQLESDLKNKGKSVISVIADVSIEEDCKGVMVQAMSAFNRIDVLINNAGISMRALFSDVDLKVIHRLMDTNFWGAVYCTKYALPFILKQQGSVVGISSIAGKKGLPGRTGYSASKFALEGFLETLRTENIKNNLHVLVACPGFTATDIRSSALSENGTQQGESARDEKQMMSPEEVAKNIFHAVIRRKRDLILTTNGKLTVFLNKFFPAFMDKIVYRHMSKEQGSPFK